MKSALMPFAVLLTFTAVGCSHGGGNNTTATGADLTIGHTLDGGTVTPLTSAQKADFESSLNNMSRPSSVASNFTTSRRLSNLDVAQALLSAISAAKMKGFEQLAKRPSAAAGTTQLSNTDDQQFLSRLEQNTNCTETVTPAGTSPSNPPSFSLSGNQTINFGFAINGANCPLNFSETVNATSTQSQAGGVNTASVNFSFGMTYAVTDSTYIQSTSISNMALNATAGITASAAQGSGNGTIGLTLDGSGSATTLKGNIAATLKALANGAVTTDANNQSHTNFSGTATVQINMPTYVALIQMSFTMTDGTTMATYYLNGVQVTADELSNPTGLGGSKSLL